MSIEKEVVRKYRLEIVDNRYFVHEIITVEYNNIDDAIQRIKNEIPDDTWDIDEEYF